MALRDNLHTSDTLAEPLVLVLDLDNRIGGSGGVGGGILAGRGGIIFRRKFGTEEKSAIL